MYRRYLVAAITLLTFPLGAWAEETPSIQIVAPGSSQNPNQQPGGIQIQNRAVAQAPAAAPKPPNANQEIIELLKQVLQKLEAQEGRRAQTPAAPLRFQIQGRDQSIKKVEAEAVQQLERARRQLEQTLQKEAKTTEVDKARAEVKAAELRLAEAKARLAKLEATQTTSGWTVISQPAPQVSKPSDVEQRLDRLLREVEQLRQEIRQQKK
jgi:hypothetical protein